jgi:TolB-like protein
LTGRNVVVGTPQYMAPEQLFEGRVDERADIFAAGVVVYEMLSGRSAFSAPTLPAILHAVGYEEPPALQGSPEIEKIDRVLRKALAKTPSDRFARTELFAAALREAIAAPDPKPRTRPHRTRFVAIPLRVLRPDPETDFLAFSIPDAVSVALSTLESVIVRSPQAANATADVRAIGRDLAVDVVLTGTLMRAGSHVRVSAQLADADAGTLIWSDVAQAPIEDLFQLQDALTSRILSSLSLPLTARDRQSLDRHAPASAEAYELYLRANELSRNPGGVSEARALHWVVRAVSSPSGRAKPASDFCRWQKRPSNGRWSWIPTCRWRTTWQPTWTPNSGARPKAWSGCFVVRPRDAPIPECWQGSSRPAGTPGCSRSRKRRMTGPSCSIPHAGPAWRGPIS